ncbi:tRNA glutamyl-Q(34) synthetase GluQRS [Devosia pacifica]|uniref:tRNA glutamyl-Q(34) synthetase GluQRS n=1 Tax=Devosia pacifica TaxID=1335967 RepID=A0A918S7W2_9HYPH|nr:tRNA glutamyl-Q(34) synthetase GluQRS [Devosia pacifica]GHA26113.1 tRNA glutamyl-Q(34) synthetase GluQRS [Devosia pacifica]
MPPPIRLRFAPSPNGYLHLGHAYSALFTWSMAHRLGGEALLRIEDIDLARCKPDFYAALSEDLNWLGLSWREPLLRQSDHFPAYHAAFARLLARELIYPCFCTRKEIAQRATATDPDGAPRYPGTCRTLSGEERERRLDQGQPVQWRLDMGQAEADAGALAVKELAPETLAESSRQAKPAAWGDAVIVRKDTPTSYHLSVVVDDAYQQISHVTRGMDLYAATDLHRLLQALLGLPSPVYCHHALINGQDERKLSKSEGAKSLRQLRSEGVSAAEIRAMLGFA